MKGWETFICVLPEREDNAVEMLHRYLYNAGSLPIVIFFSLSSNNEWFTVSFTFLSNSILLYLVTQKQFDLHQVHVLIKVNMMKVRCLKS